MYTFFWWLFGAGRRFHFLPAANEDTLCVFRLHVSCTFASIGNMRWFPLPLNQKHNVRDRDYLESNGSKQCETEGMFTNKHQESILFYTCILYYSSLGMGSATLVSLLSGIFPMPKGTPNKMKHKEIAMFVPVFHAPTWGCALFRSVYLLQTPLWLVKLFQQKTMKSLYFSGF